MATGLHNVYCGIVVRLANSQDATLPLGKSDLARFWAKVDRQAVDGCWLWQASLMGRYGQFTAMACVGRQVHLYAHRVAWEIANRQPVPDGSYVLHTCDTPRCVNPAHLFVGSQLDNMRDAKAKGRLRPGGLRKAA